MFCPNCGSQIPEGSSFCSSCGTAVPSESGKKAPEPPASAATAQENTTQGTYEQPQQPTYQQPVNQKVYAQTTGTSRAMAMSVYWGLLPLIFAGCVADKDTDPFIKHHLNQSLVILIGSIISAFLSLIIIGGLLGIFLFVMAIMGTIQAYHGEITELPLIGKIKLIK